MSLSAIYTVVHDKGWKVEDFLVKNTTFERAEKGYVYPRTEICVQFRTQVEKELGDDPGFIYYDELEFTERRDAPASAERPLVMKSAGSMFEEIHAIASHSRR